MSDFISRQAAIDAIAKMMPQSLTPDGSHPADEEIFIAQEAFADCIKTIEILPSAQPERKKGEWIPVSERLPEDYTDVLVWFEYFRYGDYNCLYQTYGIGDYIANYGWMINHETGWHKLRVIAWMPLPEPYKGDEQDG